MQPTEEMTAIYKTAHSGDSFICEAKAGSGKTTTVCNTIRNETKTKKVLYLCFNTHNIDDAKEKLRGVDNVVVTNIHKMAYAALGNQYRHKIGNMSFAKYSYELRTKDYNFTRQVRDAITNYFCSPDHIFAQHHIKTTKDSNQLKRIYMASKDLITKMIDVDNHDVKMPHDGYLHLFCTTRIGLDICLQYDLIIVDESQDQNLPVVALEKMFLNEGGQLIKVGDENQALYRFRKSINANSEFKNILPFLTLSKSFRFGNEIATLAKAIMAVKGLHNERFIANDNLTTKILPPYTKINEPRVVLHRTAAGVVRTAIELMCRQVPFNVIGGLRAYVTTELYWFELIKNNGDKKKIPQYFLKTFPSWDAVESVAKEGVDSDVSRVVKIFDICKSKGFDTIEELLLAVDNAGYDEKSEDITLTTVHRFKGSESDHVILSNDYKTLKELKKLSRDELTDEVNNLYVAVTRPRKTLIINEVVQEIIEENKKKKRYS